MLQEEDEEELEHEEEEYDNTLKNKRGDKMKNTNMRCNINEITPPDIDQLIKQCVDLGNEYVSEGECYARKESGHRELEMHELNGELSELRVEVEDKLEEIRMNEHCVEMNAFLWKNECRRRHEVKCNEVKENEQITNIMLKDYIKKLENNEKHYQQVNKECELLTRRMKDDQKKNDNFKETITNLKNEVWILKNTIKRKDEKWSKTNEQKKNQRRHHYEVKKK